MAAADCIWTGAVSGDINTAGNWTGGVPLDGETAVIPKTATNNLTASMSALGDTQLSWVVEPGSTVSVGASGSPLKVKMTDLEFYGAAPFWFDADGGTTVDAVIMAANKDVIVNLAGATFTNIHALRGNITLGSTIGNIAKLLVGYVSNMANDVTLTAATNANTITKYTQKGGTVVSNMAMTTADIAAGFLTQANTAAIATLIATGGTTWYNTSGTLTAGYIYNGATFNTNQSTLATTITTLRRYPGALGSVRIGANSTITNDGDMRGLV